MAEPKIRITAKDDTGPAFRAANKNLRELQDRAQELSRSAGAAIGTAVGSVIGAAGIAALVKDAIDAADELAKLSQRVGVTIDVMGGLAFNADLAGLSLEQIGSASDKLNRTLAEAASGTKSSKEGFDLLGVAVVDAAGKTRGVDSVMADVADRFQKFADGPEKTALAVRLFGKAGAELIPLLNGGGDAIRENIEYYKRFSGVTDELAQRSEVFNDTLTKIGVQGKSIGNTLANQLLPSLQAVADEFLRLRENGDGIPSLAAGIKSAFDAVVLTLASASYAFSVAGIRIGGLIAQFGVLSRLGTASEFTAISAAVAADIARATVEFKTFGNRVLGIGVISADDESEAERRRLGLSKPAAPRRSAPRLTPTGAADKKVRELDLTNKALASYAEQLQGTIDKTQDLTAVEEALLFLRRKGAGASLDDAAHILNLARQVDETRRLKDETQALIDIDKTLDDQAREKAQRRDDNLQRLLDATPTGQLEKSRADVALLTEEFQRFIDTAGQAGISEQTYLEAVSTRLNLTAEKLEKTKSLAEELGLTFASAAEDAIVNFTKLGNVVQGVLKDAARIVVRKTLTEPFGKYLTGALGGLSSFDGGGNTGGGARSGGLDGKGGFLAMMHPQETVIDHTKGQSAGSVTNNYFTVGDVASVSMVRKAIAESQRQTFAVARRQEMYS